MKHENIIIKVELVISWIKSYIRTSVLNDKLKEIHFTGFYVFFTEMGGIRKNVDRKWKIILWKRPTFKVIKIYFDGSYTLFNKLLVLGDCLGTTNATAFFSSQLQAINPLHAEMLACLHAIKIASYNPHINYWMESDSEMLIKMIQTNN